MTQKTLSSTSLPRFGGTLNDPGGTPASVSSCSVTGSPSEIRRASAAGRPAGTSISCVVRTSGNGTEPKFPRGAGSTTAPAMSPTWCHWPSLYEDVVRTSAYAVPVSIAARTAPRPGSARSQNWLPSYSLMTMTDKEFSIVTYQITDDGKVEEIDTIFTLEKTAEAEKAA